MILLILDHKAKVHKIQKIYNAFVKLFRVKKGNVHSSINNVLNDHEPGPFKHFYESKGEDF